MRACAFYFLEHVLFVLPRFFAVGNFTVLSALTNIRLHYFVCHRTRDFIGRSMSSVSASRPRRYSRKRETSPHELEHARIRTKLICACDKSARARADNRGGFFSIKWIASAHNFPRFRVRPCKMGRIFLRRITAYRRFAS